jgi:hypothetical protein
MTYREFEAKCHPQDRGEYTVYIPCKGESNSREACGGIHRGWHAPHWLVHSTGLNADHAAVVAANWGGKAVVE